MPFVLLHEMAHVAITQMGLPVLGRTEDAADTYAALRLIRSGSNFSHRVLIEAAEGWFLADRRDQKMGEKVAYYDEHGLNQQRAYQIVCLMVGSDDERFKDLARQTNLPDERRDGCTGDYSNAAYSWDLVLKPHRRAPDQPKTSIDVIYGPAEDRAETARQAASSIRLSETVAEHAADEFAWPAPFTLEMHSCGFPNAHWDLPSHTLTLCYELATESPTSIALIPMLERTVRQQSTAQSLRQSTHRRSSRTASRSIANLGDNELCEVARGACGASA